MTLVSEPAPGGRASERDVLLGVDDLRVAYATQDGDLMAVNGVSLSVNEGEVVALVGESGCGKTTVGRSLVGLLPGRGRIVSGDIRFGGRSVRSLSARELRRLNVAMFPFAVAQRVLIKINQQHVPHEFMPPRLNRTRRSRIDTSM